MPSKPSRPNRPHPAFFIAALTVLVGCKGEEKAQCQAMFEEAQKSIKVVKTRDIDDLRRVDGELAGAASKCEEAGVDQAITELGKAREEIAKQIDRIEKYGNTGKRAKLTEDELARLVKDGDPKCPKGQAYKHQASGKEIRCAGPLPIEMGRAQAEQYFLDRDYKIRPIDDPNTLKLEHGGELLLLEFKREEDPDPAKCVTIYPPPQQSWQEAISRFSGKNPALLRKGGSLQTKSGKMDIDVEQGKDKLVVRIGDCGK